MSNPYLSHASALTSPFSRAAAATLGVDLATPSRALYVGSSGDLAVTTIGGDTVIFKNAQAGSVIPVRAVRVEASGTTASDVIAGW